METYWDIIPPRRRTKKVKVDNTDRLITVLFIRGVSIERIFHQFYALEAQADARADEIFGNDEDGQHGERPRLTVGDALLVGAVSRDINPVTF